MSLLESGSAVNCQDYLGATPLHCAMNVGLADDVNSDVIITHLLEYGANTTLADNNGRLPLHWAANIGAYNVHTAAYLFCIQ